MSEPPKNGTPSNPDNFLPTRRTLVHKLRDRDDNDSWQEFFDTYWKLIFSVALKSGLTHAEAEEVVQETVISVAKKMDSFEYQPERCSFKGWLRHVTRLRIIDQLRKRKPDHHINRIPSDTRSSADTATIERVADPRDDELERVWNAEWEENVVGVTIERVKPHIRPEHFQIFYMNVIQGRPCREVARLMGTTVPQVYVIRHRVGKLFKQERQALEAEQEAALRSREAGAEA